MVLGEVESVRESSAMGIFAEKPAIREAFVSKMDWRSNAYRRGTFETCFSSVFGACDPGGGGREESHLQPSPL